MAILRATVAVAECAWLYGGWASASIGGCVPGCEWVSGCTRRRMGVWVWRGRGRRGRRAADEWAGHAARRILGRLRVGHEVADCCPARLVPAFRHDEPDGIIIRNPTHHEDGECQNVRQMAHLSSMCWLHHASTRGECMHEGVARVVAY